MPFCLCVLRDLCVHFRAAGVSVVSCFSPLAHVDDLRRLADLQQLERVGVVVDVGDRLPGDLDDDVALLQAGLLGRPAADHAAEQQPLHVGRVVGNRAGEDAHAGAAAAAFGLLLDLGELRRLGRCPSSRCDDRGREVDDAIEILVVDLVGGVATACGSRRACR